MWHLILSLVFVLPFTSVGLAQSNNGDRLARILDPDMLRVQVAYLETVIGPARRVSPNYGGVGQHREYRVNGCEVGALARDNEIFAYRLRLTPRCTFDVGRFGVRLPVPIHRATHGMLENALGASRFLPTCIYSCGNAADPVFSTYNVGPRALGSIELIAVSQYNADASATLLRAAERVMPQDDIAMGRFSCHPSYDRLGRAAFRNVVIDEITIGYELEPRQHQCP